MLARPFALGTLAHVAFALAALSCLGACGGSDHGLSKRIAATVAQGDGAVVDLRELTDFAWDRLHVFPPYTPADSVGAELGFGWPGAERSDIARRDDVALLVFVREGRVIRHVEQPRSQGDFAELERPGGWHPAAALFVARARGGAGHLVMVEPGEKSHRNRLPGADHP